MNSQPRMIVLLSAYNGEEYIRQQLDSLFSQTYPDFLVLVRDDGSRDATPKILADYAIRSPEKVRVLDTGSTNRGAAGSFAWLMTYALEHKADLGIEDLYLLFCDQDDVWHEDKITRQVNVMLAAEAEAASAEDEELPVLVHTDLQVVDEKLEPIADSLAQFQGLQFERNSFQNLLVSNLVTGCTVLINEQLARKAVPIPDRAIMHDWWLALVASGFGKIVYLDTPLIQYRQHSSNTIGAKEHQQLRKGSISYWEKFTELKPNAHLVEVAQQARAFQEQYKSGLNKKQRRALRFCSALASSSGLLQRIVFRIVRRL